MKHVIKSTQPVTTVGMDLSDKTACLCAMTASGQIASRPKIQLTKEDLLKAFSRFPGARVTMEAGTQSRWVAEYLMSLGHEVIVANPRELQSISGSSRKSDVRDAEQLARLTRVDAALLSPTYLRSQSRQEVLVQIRSRSALVESRTQLVNCVRGLMKMFGERVPGTTTDQFAQRALEALPATLAHLEKPLLECIQALTDGIHEYDKRIDALVGTMPEVRPLLSVKGVGALTAVSFVATLDDPKRFVKCRDVGAYLGLTPRRSQSGESDPDMRISKCGDGYLRKLLVQCAHHVLGRWGAPSALRDWGLAHAGKSKSSKKRAVIAVARKLAVLLLRLWRDQTFYQPYPTAPAAAPAPTAALCA